MQLSYTEKQTLATRQSEVPLLLYRFRFLTTYHLQQFFHHKYPTTVQGWLTSLQKQGYIYQFYERHNPNENTKPAIYCLTAKARELLKANQELEQNALKSLYREKNCSQQFREHWCFLADIYFMLQQLYEDTDEELHISTKRDLFAYPFFPDPLPDIYFATSQKRNKTKRYFLQLFDERTLRSVIRSSIRRYVSCSENQWKEETNEAFPTILLIASDKQQHEYVRRFVSRTLRQEFSELSFFLTTKEALQKEGFTNETWQKVEV